jgi:hypothetical protein
VPIGRVSKGERQQSHAFNNRGDQVINLTTSGDPGAHAIALYLGLCDGPRDVQRLCRPPQRRTPTITRATSSRLFTSLSSSLAGEDDLMLLATRFASS